MARYEAYCPGTLNNTTGPDRNPMLRMRHTGTENRVCIYTISHIL